jgi:hypothetical protein
MNTLSFPVKKFKYYEFYTSFIKSIFEVADYKVILDPSLEYLAPAAFYIKINGKLAFVEMSDFDDEHVYKLDTNSGWTRLHKFYEPETLDVPIFKRSMRPNKKYSDNTYPMGPFYVGNNVDNSDLKTLLSYGNIYNPFDNDGIIKTNRVWGGALVTRADAYSKINKELIPRATMLEDRLPLYSHWLRHGKCLSSLNISGASYHSQDIGAVEAMFLGVCCLSNDFDMLLPYNKVLEKGVHYIHIADDYTNINECINYLYDNRNECKDIGNEAYDLMIKTCSPKALADWIINTTEDYYD